MAAWFMTCTARRTRQERFCSMKCGRRARPILRTLGQIISCGGTREKMCCVRIALPVSGKSYCSYCAERRRSSSEFPTFFEASLRQIVTRAGADFQVLLVDGDCDFVIAGARGVRRGIAQVVLRGQLATDLIDRIFD